MVFSSLTFLFAYLPIVLLIYFFTPQRFRNLALFLVSLFFYGWGEPVYVLVMLFSITMNYIFGIQIDRNKGTQKAKKILIACIVMNLALLGFFKYWDFFATNLHLIGLRFIPVLNLSLPIGISFYTFQTMSYPIDLYRGETSVQKNLIHFGTYVTMFPQLIAGPIVRYVDIADQLESREESIDLFADGVSRFMVGLSKKVLLANSCGQVWESINTIMPGDTAVVTAWIGILCYTLQIYFDFSGYSDMAIGLGKMFGFHFLENFNYPYISKSITEFWRRWHMSLSFWFRDYVYIPLGGNRCAFKRQLMNIMVVWLLTGFWHGASWNFVLWGVFYGILLILEKNVLLKYLEKAPAWVSHLYTMVIVMCMWVLFANTDIKQDFHYLSMMFGNASAFINETTIYYLRDNLFLLVISILACTPLIKNDAIVQFMKKHSYVRPILVGISFILCVIFIVDGTYNPFLYFRF